MAIELTLSSIKPDAVAKNVIGKIYSRFETNGLKVIAAKLAWLSPQEAGAFYAAMLKFSIGHAEMFLPRGLRASLLIATLLGLNIVALGTAHAQVLLLPVDRGGETQPDVSPVADMAATTGTTLRSHDAAREALEERYGVDPPEMSESDLARWVASSRQAVRSLARADYDGARSALAQAESVSDRALAKLNREATRSRQVLDTCLYLVRSLEETDQHARALEQGFSCRRLVPRGAATPTQHPPEVRAILDEVDRTLAAMTHLVPVGKDQKQHLELSRDLAERFNRDYGQAFIVPDPFIPPVGANILSLQDPAKKMSKSDENPNGSIFLLDDPDTIAKKIKRAVTDSGTTMVFDESRPAIHNLLTIYHLMTGKSANEIETHFQGKGYGHLKSELADAVVDFLKPFQERIKDFDDASLEKILREGAEKARTVARATLTDVYAKMGIRR